MTTQLAIEQAFMKDIEAQQPRQTAVPSILVSEILAISHKKLVRSIGSNLAILSALGEIKEENNRYLLNKNQVICLLFKHAKTYNKAASSLALIDFMND
ncbi:MAG: hypothetical protein DRQ98_12820 [Gammaproteobacteria bacterium]|nr:MAG: hypothetical protein DRQ98_12820 [Gammaproteobacteria bacterium]